MRLLNQLESGTSSIELTLRARVGVESPGDANVFSRRSKVSREVDFGERAGIGTVSSSTITGSAAVNRGVVRAACATSIFDAEDAGERPRAIRECWS